MTQFSDKDVPQGGKLVKREVEKIKMSLEGKNWGKRERKRY